MEEKIIEILSNPDRPSQTFEEIKDKLGYETVEEYKKLRETLDKMLKERTIFLSKKQKYLLKSNSHLVDGELVTINSNGNGYVRIDNKNKDIFISKENLNGARIGDIVSINFIKNKTEGRITDIIQRNEKEFVGIVYFKNGKCYVKPDKKSNIDIEIIPESQKGLVEGYKVLVKPDDSNKYQGSVLNVIGHKDDVGVDILSYVYEHGFNIEFSEKVKEELKNIPDTIENEDISDRSDYRGKVIVTIDGDDTKDIDDAISLEDLPDGTYELGVHIADVSHYVQRGSAIFDEAFARGTSVYLVDRVIPMIPHQLSNGICSLNPNVDRLAVSCIMKINKRGEIIDKKITKSVIRSRIKMTYNKVNDILDKGIVAEGYEDYVDKLKLMKELSDILRMKMIRRGYIDFESREPKIIVDENCHPKEIKIRNEGTGENIIENFMIAANETVANFISSHNVPGIYRVHGTPDEKRLQKFFNYLSYNKGYKPDFKIKNVTNKDLQRLLNQLDDIYKDKELIKVLHQMIIRCQAKAIYSTEETGHFALGNDYYTHFTSPIRRFPDLIVHRIVKRLLTIIEQEKKDDLDNYDEDEEFLKAAAKQASVREQDAQKCERDVDDMKMAEYMEEHIGEEFEGVISGVKNYGIYVELPNTIEGLVKLENMPSGGKYECLEEFQTFINRGVNLKLTIGDSVKVKCIRADKETSQIDFQLLEKIKKDDNNYSEKRTEFKKEVKRYEKSKKRTRSKKKRR